MTRPEENCNKLHQVGEKLQRAEANRRCVYGCAYADLDRERSAITQNPCKSYGPGNATLMAFGHPCPVSDLFGVGGRQLLERLALPEAWRETLETSLLLVDELDEEIHECERDFKRLGADHRYVPLLTTIPGIAWTLGYTIAAEIGDIARFPSPVKLIGYTGLCPRVYQSGESDRRGPLRKNGPRYLRWALIEAPARRALAGLPLPRPLRADARPDRQKPRRQGRQGRDREKARRGDLAHAHSQRALQPLLRQAPCVSDR
jgi:hypothetical protein